MIMGEPNEYLQYFLELQKQKNNNKEGRRGETCSRKKKNI
jgi:hypothetical protein